MEEIDYKKYMLKNDEWEFKVGDFEFSCKDISIEEEADFLQFYITPTGHYNLLKLRIVQATKLVKTPFTRDWISSVFNKYYEDYELKSTEWEKMSLAERLMFLTKLENSFMNEIISNLGKHYSPVEEVVKN